MERTPKFPAGKKQNKLLFLPSPFYSAYYLPDFAFPQEIFLFFLLEGGLLGA